MLRTKGGGAGGSTGFEQYQKPKAIAGGMQALKPEGSGLSGVYWSSYCVVNSKYLKYFWLSIAA